MSGKKQPLAPRFWRKVDKTGPDGCWLWTGSKDRLGRGSFHFMGRTKMAHQVSAHLAGIDVPDGRCICHRCDNPSCVNPAHFFVGTQAENIADMWAKGRGVRPISINPWAGVRYSRPTVERVFQLCAMGLRQHQIATEVGMSAPNVSYILSGKSRSVA